jgi:GntR family transcriptional regulator
LRVSAPIAVNPKDPTPLYAQLEQAIRVAIATGALQPGDQLPTVRQLAVDLRINANTVGRVYVGLERDGVVVTRRGVGTFIAEGVEAAAHGAQRERRLTALAGRFLTEATQLGYSPREVLGHLAQRIKQGE